MRDCYDTPEDLFGKLTIIGRPDMRAYPVHVSFTYGDMYDTLATLNAGSPYPLEILAAYYCYPNEFLQLQQSLETNTPQRQGDWWAQSNMTDYLLTGPGIAPTVAEETANVLEFEVA